MAKYLTKIPIKGHTIPSLQLGSYFLLGKEKLVFFCFLFMIFYYSLRMYILHLQSTIKYSKSLHKKYICTDHVDVFKHVVKK